MTKIFVTGGAGFIGSNFIHYVLRNHHDWEVTNLDKLTYAGNLENLQDMEDDGRYSFIRGDIEDRELIDEVISNHFDIIVNLAAESHVDRSILDPSPFIETNVRGTQVLLEAARQYKVARFIQISTDEVYGSLAAGGKFSEESPLLPNSPYAASKAAADFLCRAYYNTYGLPVIITRSSNNYGPFQFPEKIIPLAITNALEGKLIPIYGDGLNVRDWIHVDDHCCALDVIIQKGRIGDVYNIGGSNERTNLELVRMILDILGKPDSLIAFVADRPGHDHRYALDITKIVRELGWRPSYPFEEALKDTVNWYKEHESWWRRIKSGEYAEYYRKMYSFR